MVEELDIILKKLKNIKAPGKDGLNSDMFKYASKCSIMALSQKAIVMPTHNEGYTQNQENYGGIRLFIKCWL